ncbi:VTT domain-containing protein [Ligilactobacillus faecis]|uniref:TVP38/TMEM64 family membrane protein n=1 Tax=Ligilactobacillus faecis TaxID=762833 RepID=A0ABV4DPA0_9LACO
MKKLRIRRRTAIYVTSILGVVLVSVLLYIFFLEHSAQFMQFFDPDKDKLLLMRTFRDRSPKDALLLILLTALTSAVPALSSSVICIFNGVCFGPFLGLLLNITGNTLGNSLVAGFFRKFSDEREPDHKHKRPNRLFERLAHFKNKMLALILGYMIPIIPSSLVNYFGAKSKISSKKQLLCIIIGVIPTSFLYAYGGEAIFNGNVVRLGVSILCVVVLGAAGIEFYRKHRHEKK